MAVSDHLRGDHEKQRIRPHILKLHSLNFSFNSNYYLQIRGTTMGIPVTPIYANLFMDRSETKTLDNWPDNHYSGSGS